MERKERVGFKRNEPCTFQRKAMKPKFHRLSFWASCRIRTNDPEITNHVLWPTELKRRVGKLSVSHRYNRLPLLRSSPGGFDGSWPYSTYPYCGAKVRTLALTTKLSLSFFRFRHVLLSLFNHFPACFLLKTTFFQTKTALFLLTMTSFQLTKSLFQVKDNFLPAIF